jgi:hypothetical protein
MKVGQKEINVALGAISLVSLIIFLLLNFNFLLILLCCIIPGFLLSFFFDLKEVTFLERILISFGLWTLLFIVVYAVALLKIPILNNFFFFLLFLIFPISVAIINRKRISDFFNLEFGKKLRNNFEESGNTILLVIVTIFIVIFMFYPLLSGNTVAQTDANLEQWWGYNIQQNILKASTIYMWTPNELNGYPIYTFETFFSHFKLGIFDYIFSNLNFHLVSNNLFLIHYIIFAIGIFALLRRLDVNKLLSFIVPFVVFFVSTILHAPLNGAFRPAFATSFFPITFILFILVFKEPRYWILTSLFMLILFFHHPMYGVNISILIALSYIVYKIVHKLKNLKNKKERIFTRDEIKYLSFAIICFVLIISFWITSFLLLKSNFAIEMNEGRALPQKNLLGTLFSTYLPIKGYLFFEILAVMGIVYCIATIKKNETSRILFSIFSAVMILYVLFLIPGTSEIAKKWLPTGLYLSKIYGMLLILYIPFAFHLLKNKVVKYIVFLLFVGIVVVNIIDVSEFSKEIITETIQNNNIPQITDKLKYSEYGKFLIYGIYTTTVEPAFQILSGKPMIGLGTQLATNTMIVYKLRLMDGSGRLLEQNLNQNYYVNIMKHGFVKYVFIFRCDGYRQGAITEQFLQSKLKLIYYDQPYEKSCLTLYEVPDSNFVEKTKIAKINVPENTFYSINDAWKVSGFKNPEDYNEITPDITINFDSDLSNFTKPEVLRYKINNDEEMKIYGDFSDGDWIIIKQDYFPRFHAYENGKELEIKEQNLGMILIKATKGNEIIYKYESFRFEIILAIMSSFVVLLIFLFWGKIYEQIQKI